MDATAHGNILDVLRISVECQLPYAARDVSNQTFVTPICAWRPQNYLQALRFGAESSPTSKRWNFFKRVARFQENSFRITL